LGGSQFKASLGKKLADSISKITRTKWAGGVTQGESHQKMREREEILLKGHVLYDTYFEIVKNIYLE
jgi:hypothetical protein